MFGGYGLYCGRIFFAIIHKGRLFFKVSDESRSQYEEMGAKPFEPKPGDVMRSYYEVPVDVLENPTMLQEWADLALTIME